MKAKKSGVKASFFRRFVAYILDVLVVTLIIGLPMGFAYESIDEKSLRYEFISDKGFDVKDLLLSTLVGILTILYWAILEFKLNQSVGKMLLKIYVVSKRRELTFWQCILRNLTKVSGFFLVLDCVYMFVKRTNQRYMETIAETEVLKYE